jgi:hypothetical protein
MGTRERDNRKTIRKGGYRPAMMMRPERWTDHESFSELKINLAGICDSLRGIKNLKRDKIPVLVIVENDSGFILVTFVDDHVVF